MSANETDVARTHADDPRLRALIERGLAHHQAGRLRRAQRLYHEVLGAAPQHPDALHLLGMTAYQSGDLVLATERIGAAIAVRPDYAPYHQDLGIVAQAHGRLDDAMRHYERALVLDPDQIEARFNAAALLQAQGRFDVAVARYRDVLALDPRQAGAHHNLGTALQSLGRHGEAIASYRAALALAPRGVDTHFNLGNALRETGDLVGAAASYRAAIALRPGHAQALNNLATVLLLQGDRDGAAAGYRAALRSQPGLVDAHFNLGALLEAQAPAEALESAAAAVALDASPAFTASLARCMIAAGGVPDTAAMRALVERALAAPWARPADLARVAARLLRDDGALATAFAQAAGWTSAENASHPWEVLAADALLEALLVSAPVADLALEGWLTRIRAALLHAVARGVVLPPSAQAFACTLARQCFINEYVFTLDADQQADAGALRERVASELPNGGRIDPDALIMLAACAPIAGLPHADALLARTWPDAVSHLLVRQVADPLAERALRAALPRLSSIADPVSRQVQRQYEENPYPRWTGVPRATPGWTLEADLRAQFPAAAGRALPSGDALDVLVAGAGTGQEPIEIAQRYPAARILAIDLSAASLAYAARETAARGLTQVAYAQADLLELGGCEQRFDVISSVGVLHHLADPQAGWRTLLSLLRPEGVMQIGLYSERGRRDVVAAREWLAAHGYASGSADIAQARPALLAAEHGRFAPLAAFHDFHSTSECRDLLFHVQERRYTLPALALALQELRLELLGFVVPRSIRARYRARFPADEAATDLVCWDAFEAEAPDTFRAMYVFWVRRAAP